MIRSAFTFDEYEEVDALDLQKYSLSFSTLTSCLVPGIPRRGQSATVRSPWQASFVLRREEGLGKGEKDTQ